MKDRNLPKIALGLEYPLNLRAGVSVVVGELIRELSRHYDIVLISPDSPKEIFDWPIVEQLRWDPEAVSLKNSRALAKRLEQLGVQLVHLHFGGVFAWGVRVFGRTPACWIARRNIPVMTTVHAARSLLDGFCGPAKPLALKLMLLPAAWLGKLDQVRRVRTEITVSRDNLEKLRRWYWPCRSKFHQIYHSRIRCDSVNPPGPGEREKIILSVGYITFLKGQHLLVRAFAGLTAKFPDWKVVLVGHTSETAALDEIEKTIREQGLADRISILGSHADVHKLMGSAEIFAMPSLHESLGLALQEALFHGCACVGSRLGGIPELIEDEQSGLLFSPGNVDELEAALARLMSDGPLRRRFGTRGRQLVLEKGMTSEHMIESYRRIYESILG